MKKFKVKETNVKTFLDMMKQVSPIAYKNDMMDYNKDSDYVKITLMSDKEMKRYYPNRFIKGNLYKVTGGESESDRLGYWWSFYIGEIIKCTNPDMIDGRERHVVEFQSTVRDRTQHMPQEHLRELVKKCKR